MTRLVTHVYYRLTHETPTGISKRRRARQTNTHRCKCSSRCFVPNFVPPSLLSMQGTDACRGNLPWTSLPARSIYIGPQLARSGMSLRRITTHCVCTESPPPGAQGVSSVRHCRCVCVIFRPIAGFSMKLDCTIDMIQLRRPNFHLWHARSLGLLVFIGNSASRDSELDRRALRLAAFEAMTDHQEESRCQEEQDDGNDNSDDDRS